MSVQDQLSRLPAPGLSSALLVLAVILGLLQLSHFVLGLARGIWIYFLRPGKNLKNLGQWAVVTGATDGIGKAYASALAKKGLKIVLVSRSTSKLDAAAQELKSEYNVDTQQLTVDFSTADAQTYSQLSDSLSGLDIGVLVNNVGLSYDHAEYYDKIDDQLIDDLVAINIQATNKVTRSVLPGMIQRKRGAIVNIGSAAATVAPSGPLYAVYAGTKAYVDMFSKSLDQEYAKDGISVQNQAPAFVATKMSKIRKANISTPTPATWVAAAIKHIGYEATSCPFWFHGVMWYVASSLPQAAVRAYILNMHLALHKAYKRKRDRDAKKP